MKNYQAMGQINKDNVIVCDLNYKMSSSLEQNLTNSIRRAKEKVFSLQQSSSLSANSHQQPQKSHKSSQQHEHALVSALKTLQEKIAQLESQKEELIRDKLMKQTMKNSERVDQDIEVTRLRLELVQKNQYLRRVKEQNQELVSCNQELNDKVTHYQQKLSDQLGMSVSKESKMNSAAENTLSNLRKQKTELEQRLEVTRSTLQKIMKELQQTKKALAEQKRTNLRWLKLYEQQTLSTPNKQNSSIEANTPHTQQRSPQKQYSQVLQVNKELGQQLNRNRRKTSRLSKELQESEERYAKLRLLVQEICQTIHKVAPPINSHLRFLLGRIDKIDHPHLHSLRSISTHSRKNVFRRTNSKQHKKSLKMEDLNSSGKKSQERSSSRKIQRSSSKKYKESTSSSKKRSQDRLRIRSLAEPIEKRPEQEQLQLIEKEIVSLKRQHRNLIVRSRQEQDKSQQIDDLLQQIEQKQLAAEQLKIHLANKLPYGHQ